MVIPPGRLCDVEWGAAIGCLSTAGTAGGSGGRLADQHLHLPCLL
jgi:hypothetical protein